MMIYFLCKDYTEVNFGEIEALMRNLETDNILVVTTDYNRFLNHDNRKINIPSINMFDFFQVIVPQHQGSKIFIQNPEIVTDEPVVQEGQTQYFFQKGRKVAQKELLGDAYGESSLQTDNIQFFDQYNDVTMADYYDVRGFKSMSVLQGQNGGVAQEMMYTINGDACLTFFYQLVGNSVLNTLIQLKTNQSEQVFTNRTELIAFFLQDYNLTPDLIVSSLPDNVNKKIKTQAPIWQNNSDGIWNEGSKVSIQDLSKWRGYVKGGSKV